MPAVKFAAFAAFHPAIVNSGPHRAVVGGEDENGVLLQPVFAEKLAHFAHVFVNVSDHAVVVGHVVRQVRVELGKALRRVHGPVRGVGGYVGEKRLGAVLVGQDETLGVVEKDVGAEPGRRLGLGVVEVGAVKVGVVPKIRRLAHAAAAVAQHLIEPAIFGPEGVVVAQVPFAEHPGHVAAVLEVLGQGHLVFADHGAAHDGVPDAGPVGPVTGQEPGAGWRARRRHVVILQPHRLAVELVQIRRFDDGIAMRGDVWVALIVGDDEDDVRLAGETGGSGENEQEEGSDGAFGHDWWVLRANLETGNQQNQPAFGNAR